MMIELAATTGGVLLPVKAQPGSKKNEIRGEQDGALKVCVTQIAEKGKANRVIQAFLAQSLGIRKSQVELHSGETSSRKIFLIRDLDGPGLALKLAPFLASDDANRP